MPEFLTLVPPSHAINLLYKSFAPNITAESIPTEESLGRILTKTILAPHPLPEFSKTTVDGYAVKANDTFGAKDSLPAYLELIGEVTMGENSPIRINSNQCATIHTGGMIPEGADAVVMIEYTQQISGSEIELYKAVAQNENIIHVGEDILKSQEMINTGDIIKPADIGSLMALGITSIDVNQRPKVGIISSGDEVIPPHKSPTLGQVRDINSYSLKALVEKFGGIPILFGIAPDDFDTLFETANKALELCDVVIITAGSSASIRDLTSRVIDNLGKPGVLTHGINIKPGKPTIIGVCNNKPVIGLPGNPVSALVVANLILQPIINSLLGKQENKYPESIKATLSINLSSQSGREDWIPVRLIQDGDNTIAEPIFGKSNLIFTLSKSDGLIMIEPDSNGISSGSEVLVFNI